MTRSTWLTPLFGILCCATRLAAQQTIGLDLVPTESPYVQEGFDLRWNAAPPGLSDEPQFSSDLSRWKVLRREFPTTAPLHSGITMPLEEGEYFFRVIRHEPNDGTPPAGVTGINLSASSSGSPTILAWIDSIDPDVVSYEIIPEDGDGSFFTVPPGIETFTFPAGATSAGATIRAVDAGGNRSEGQFITNSAPHPEFPGFRLIASPSEAFIGRTGATTLFARVDPVPVRPLRFVWSTGARYGTLDGLDPAFPPTVEETTSGGTSQVAYSAHLLANPGGREDIHISVFDAADPANINDLAEGGIVVEVAPPLPQEADFRTFEVTTDGTNPGRLTTLFGHAWVFKKIPGFTTYVGTLLAQPGQGWSFGPVGVERVWRTTLQDVDEFVQNYGGNHINLLEDELAQVSYGSGVTNYNPDESRWQDALTQQREAQARAGQADYSVMPQIKTR